MRRKAYEELKKEIFVQNVVTSAAFNQQVDLDAVVKAFPHVEYPPEVFPGLTFRLKKPKTCTLIFKTEKMVCTGAKSEKEARKVILKVADELKRKKYNHRQKARDSYPEYCCLWKLRRRN